METPRDAFTYPSSPPSKRLSPAVNLGPSRPTDSLWLLLYAALITPIPLLAIYVENSATYFGIFWLTEERLNARWLEGDGALPSFKADWRFPATWHSMGRSWEAGCYLLVTTVSAHKCWIGEWEINQRKKIQDPAGIWTQNLLNTSQTLLPLSHWTLRRGAEDKLHKQHCLECPVA